MNFPIACMNAMADGGSGVGVGDLGPAGLAVGAIGLFLTSSLRPRWQEQVLFLAFCAVGSMVFGGVFLGLPFQATPFGLSTIPLFVVAALWLHVRRPAEWDVKPSPRATDWRAADRKVKNVEEPVEENEADVPSVR